MEKGLKDKHELDKKSKLSLNEIKDLISHKGLNKKTPIIEEMNKFIQKQLIDSQIEQEKLKTKQGENKNEIIIKVDKTLIDVISEIFNIEKFELAYDLLVNLELYELTEEYQAEIFKNFNSKIKKTYDSKKDGDKLLILMTKIFGKKNIITYHSLNNDSENYVQIAFLKGKFEFINNNFNFNDAELYTYGNYHRIDRETSFLFFKKQNSRIYAKIENDCIYIIFYEQDIRLFIAKIRNNFMKYPVLVLPGNENFIEEFFENNSENKVSELFKKYRAYEINFNEIVVYELLEE